MDRANAELNTEDLVGDVEQLLRPAPLHSPSPFASLPSNISEAARASHERRSGENPFGGAAARGGGGGGGDGSIELSSLATSLTSGAGESARSAAEGGDFRAPVPAPNDARSGIGGGGLVRRRQGRQGRRPRQQPSKHVNNPTTSNRSADNDEMGGEAATVSPAPAVTEGEVGSDAAGRYHKARLRALQQQVDHFSGEVASLQAALGDSDVRAKHEAEEARWRERQVAQLQEKLAKEGRARASAEGEVARLRGDVAEMRQELEGAQRWARGTDSEARSRDVRLNRALEEARKAKEKLVVECAANADDAEGKRREQKRLETRANRLERQKNELLAAFRKQVKLIDVLKRQKVHIEAARALAFTEEEFMKALEWSAA